MNSGFTPEKINKLADLLMIGLTDEETKMILDEFESIDANINKINEIEELSNVVPMTHTLDNFDCVLREDIAEESVPVRDLLKNCDDVDTNCVSVVKVVE